MKTMKRFFTARRIIAVALLCALLSFSLGATDCGKKDETPEQAKQRYVSYARDVSMAVDQLQPLVAQVNPQAGRIVAKAQPIAREVIAAIDRGNIENAVELLRTLVPLVNEITPMFSNNPEVLAIAAIANIGLHLLLKYLPVPKAAATKRTRGAAIDPLLEFKAQPVWGCDYHPERCKELKK